MFFKQLFDPTSSTYTYLIADDETHEAVLIDPVIEQLERDLKLIREHDLTLKHILETHVHADHRWRSSRPPGRKPRYRTTVTRKATTACWKTATLFCSAARRFW